MVPWARLLWLRPFSRTDQLGDDDQLWRSGRDLDAVQALEKRTAELKQKEAQMAVLQSEVKDLKAKHAYFEIVAARLEALELRNNHSIQITAEKSLGDQMVDVMP